MQRLVPPPRTWHHTDFDVHDLLGKKEALDTTISVVIPARNEEGQVGKVVETLHRHLIRDLPLVDELLVIDGDSDDGTTREAQAAGARVRCQSDVLPHLGTARGKGEALWKGLAASSGDLVVYIDGDIVDIGPHFVTGLVGPLLMDPAIEFVKATYDRPFATGDVVRPTGGGRVTELLARPLVATFWPELSWLAQPLSGEYAGRRELLTTLPFVQGYGVELVMLIDILEHRGAEVIGQIDLDLRRHTHQSIDALGRMATEILAGALSRLSRSDDVDLPLADLVTLLQPVRTDGDLMLRPHQIGTSERPPLGDLQDR